MSNGRVGRYEVYFSDDGKDWGRTVASGKLTDSASEVSIELARPITAQYIKFVALDEVNGNFFASIGEISVTIQ